MTEEFKEIVAGFSIGYITVIFGYLIMTIIALLSNQKHKIAILVSNVVFTLVLLLPLVASIYIIPHVSEWVGVTILAVSIIYYIVFMFWAGAECDDRYNGIFNVKASVENYIIDNKNYNYEIQRLNNQYKNQIS